MILVIGATGATGAPTVRNLIARGAAVRVVTRDPAKAETIPDLAGAEIIAGDSSLPETLFQALQGVDSLYLVPPAHPDTGNLQVSLIDTAKRAGVRSIVKISAMCAGVKEPSIFMRAHAQSDQHLSLSGLAYTIVRPNAFFQNTLLDATTIKSMRKIFGCSGDSCTARIDCRDIGEVVAKLLLEGNHSGTTYELTGPEPLSLHDIARILTKNLNQAIEVIDMPPDAYAAALASFGLPSWLAQEVSDIYGRGAFRNGEAARTTEDVELLLGRPPRRFDEFVRDHFSIFST